jgi:DNA-binding NtrC family response regulator
MRIERAVIVDDEASDREMMERTLRRLGIGDIRSYESLPDRADLRDGPDCLLIIDLVLGPDMDGVLVLKTLASGGPLASPILVVSGSLPSMLRVTETYGAALGLNIVGALEKPVPEADLASLLGR